MTAGPQGEPSKIRTGRQLRGHFAVEIGETSSGIEIGSGQSLEGRSGKLLVTSPRRGPWN